LNYPAAQLSSKSCLNRVLTCSKHGNNLRVLVAFSNINVPQANSGWVAVTSRVISWGFI
jgi:hypothetical protein